VNFRSVVIVRGPWWATWWAYFIYGFLFLSLVYLIRRYELNRQNLKHHLELEKLDKTRLQELDGFKSR